MSLSRQRKEESDGKEDKIVRRSDSEDIIEEWIQEDVEGEERECAQGGEEMQDPDEVKQSTLNEMSSVSYENGTESSLFNVFIPGYN